MKVTDGVQSVRSVVVGSPEILKKLGTDVGFVILERLRSIEVVCEVRVPIAFVGDQRRMRLPARRNHRFEPREEGCFVKFRHRHVFAGSRRCRRFNRSLPLFNLPLFGDGEFLNTPVGLRRELFVLAGEQNRLLNTEGSSVSLQLLKRLTVLEGHAGVALQVKPAIGLDDDHLPLPSTKPVSHEPRYKSRKTENESLKIQVLR